MTLSIPGFAGPPRFPDPPAAGEFLRDEAAIIDGPQAEALRELGEKLLAEEKGTPIFLLTLSSIGSYGVSSEWTVSSYTRALFIDWASVAAVPPEANLTNGESAAAFPTTAFAQRGLLVVISLADERVAVAMGSHWQSASEAVDGLRDVFAFHLERGDTKTALDRGTAALGTLVRRETVPVPRRFPFLAPTLFVVLFLLVFVTVVACVRQGSENPLWKFWVSVFSALGTGLTVLLRRGVNLTARLSGERAGRADEGRVSIGRW